MQNTVTNLGASIGTALAGAVLIATLSASFLTGIQNNPAVPAEVKSKAQVELAAGVPFVSDADLKTALDDAGVPTPSSRRDRRRERDRTPRWAALIDVGARRDRVDRAVLQPRDPDRAAGVHATDLKRPRGALGVALWATLEPRQR